MINAVTGLGPRTGTSYVMRACKDAGLPIHYDPVLEQMLPSSGNPQGYWEANPKDLSGLRYGIAKVWPVYLPLPKINRMVILRRRDLTDQLNSIRKQAVREATLVESLMPQFYVEQAYQDTLSWLSTSNVDFRVYDTEDLSININNILDYLGE